MQKIMFDDRFGLTQAVLEGRKTRTSRVIKAPRTMDGKDVYGFSVVSYRNGEIAEVMSVDEDGAMINNILPKYKVGEVVAVAQPYCKIMPYLADSFYKPAGGFMEEKPGYRNKMFVRADLMPHQIRITSVRIERIQDISDGDCLREGIVKALGLYGCEGVCERGDQLFFCNPREAFASLLKKVCGRKVWDNNQWVFVYEFELVK